MAFIAIWSGWIVLSRYGVQTKLSAIDLTFIRFATAFVCSIPLWFFYKWRPIPWYRLLVIGWGTGAVYTTLSFLALANAKAASAGVLVNGLLPVFGAIIGWIWGRHPVSWITVLCITAIIIADALLIGADWYLMSSSKGLLSVGLFVAASATFSLYLVSVKNWSIGLMDVVIWVPIVNFVTVLPVWLFSNTGIPQADFSEVVLQAVYQGIVVTLFAGFIVAFTVARLGAVTTSLFMAFVPSVTAVAAWLLLNESLGWLEVVSLTICTIALIANSYWGVRAKS